jgi:hypothetical protein
VWAQDGARAGQRRTAIGLRLESEPIAGKGKALTGGPRPSAREGGREKEGGWRAGDLGQGKELVRAWEERGERPAAVGQRGGERRDGLGWAAREK